MADVFASAIFISWRAEWRANGESKFSARDVLTFTLENYEE